MCGVIILKPLNKEMAHFYLLSVFQCLRKGQIPRLQPSYLLVQIIFAAVLFWICKMHAEKD